MTEQPRFTNRLKSESSLYLKQHVHNPVDWYPWGQEAISQAQTLDRPIFLSIGYSACHWCHVMEHESFEDEATAKILNDHFISVKVDREERPDLDQIYMNYVQMATGQGGWPMTVFLTPDLEPFFGGTYFPPDDRYGRPGFQRILDALADAWANRKDEVRPSAAQIAGQVRDSFRMEPGTSDLEPQLIRRAVSALERAYDSTHGGFGSAPKFPHPMELRLLLRAWKRFDDEDALGMARHTLDRMAMGGIYDHLGGGFHRYSTDARWLVPHFEKMLYDNALLAVAYVEAFQATGDPFYRQVVEETLAYVRREMTAPEGGFYSTQDADSEGVEGKFFVWSAQEIETILGKERAEAFGYIYGVTEEGNWEESNILHRAKTFSQDARLLNRDESELKALVADCKPKLFEVRSRRIAPGRDEKILTSWNALMIEAFALAAQAFDDATYSETASRAADFILKTLPPPDGRLFRTTSAGTQPKLNAYLDDYAYLVNALAALYEATFVARWLEAALDTATVMIDQFWDPAEGGFFYTGKDHEALIARSKDPNDSSVPSGNSMAVTALLRLAKLTGRSDLAEKADTTLKAFSGLLTGSPLAAGQMLIALDFALGPVDEFAVVGDPKAEETKSVIRTLRSEFRPNKVVGFASTSDTTTPEPLRAFLGDKTSKGPVTTYICRDFACQSPIAGADALKAALGKTT